MGCLRLFQPVSSIGLGHRRYSHGPCWPLDSEQCNGDGAVLRLDCSSLAWIVLLLLLLWCALRGVLLLLLRLLPLCALLGLLMGLLLGLLLLLLLL